MRKYRIFFIIKFNKNKLSTLENLSGQSIDVEKNCRPKVKHAVSNSYD